MPIIPKAEQALPKPEPKPKLSKVARKLAFNSGNKMTAITDAMSEGIIERE